MKLTKRQQDLIAEIALRITTIVRNLEEKNYLTAALVAQHIADSWAILESKSQEWGVIYDLMHRSGSNV